MADHYLKFIGQPGQFVPGVPASDHVVTNKEQADELAASGLYEEVKEPPRASTNEEA